MNKPEERAAEMMRERFGHAYFEPHACAAMERLIAAALREAETAMKERCAEACTAQSRGSGTVFRADDDACERCAAAIRNLVAWTQPRP